LRSEDEKAIKEMMMYRKARVDDDALEILGDDGL
jgi:hypothetical protein